MVLRCTVFKRGYEKNVFIAALLDNVYKIFITQLKYSYNASFISPLNEVSEGKNTIILYLNVIVLLSYSFHFKNEMIQDLS